MKKKPPGPTKTARTLENIKRVRVALLRSPGRSAHQHASEMRISRESLCAILQKQIKLHTYKMSIVQNLETGDYEQRHNFACLKQVILGDKENAVILMSEEAHFHLNG